MRTFTFIFAVITFGIATTTAQANWQYTRWGMTVEQVKAASHGEAVDATAAESDSFSSKDSSDTSRLTAPYASGAFQFKAHFNFGTTGKLDGIVLELVNGNPHEVVGALHRKYGTPANENTSDPNWKSWMWRAGGDQIEASLIGEALLLAYVPRHSSNENGL